MKQLMNITSFMFQPLLMPLYGVIILMQHPLFRFLGSNYIYLAILGTLMFTAILPALPIFLMIKRGQIKDSFISNREERTMPYLFSFLSYIFWVLFLSRVLMFPQALVWLGVGTVISLIFLTFINLKWKISAHATAMGGFVGSIIGASWVLTVNPTMLLIVSILVSGLVCISRLYLKAHTLAQVLAGFALGFSTVLLTLVIFLKTLG